MQRHYDKMNEKRRAAFDAEMDARFMQRFADVIVVNAVVDYRTMGRWTAALVLPNGRSVMPTKCKTTEEGSYMEVEATFPRVINGEPIIRPGDKVLTLVVGVLVGSTVAVKESFVFKLDEMVYKGKLEL